MLERRFSVAIATYNRANYVLETIKSVKHQTYPAYEIIVVVDGSQDDTVERICEAYPDVKLFVQSNLGPAVAHNTGTALATGDWICFLDDDDLWHRRKLEVTAAYLDMHPDCEAVRNPLWFFSESEDGNKAGFGFQRDFVARNLEECHRAVENGDPSRNSWDYLKIEGDSFRLMLEMNCGALSSTIVKKEILVRAGGFCPMHGYGDDWNVFINVARLCEWHTIPERLTFYRFHRAQASGSVQHSVETLTVLVNAWYSGRCFPHRSTPDEMRGALSKYGVFYRGMVQRYFWEALLRGQLRVAQIVRTLGRLLLPKTSDWIYVHIPPQVTWRWDRYVLGKHR